MLGDGYKCLMEESGIYRASGELFNGGKCYLQCVGCVVALIGENVFFASTRNKQLFLTYHISPYKKIRNSIQM